MYRLQIRSVLTIVFFVFTLSVLLLQIPQKLSAQTEIGINTLSVDIQPRTPSPGQLTTITLYSAGANLGRSTIRWSLNGNPAPAADGKTSFTFTMGSIGTKTTASVRIESQGRAPIERSFSFSPGSVTLLVEGQTYIPSFYKGVPNYSSGADLTVVALPTVFGDSGAKIPDSELSFEWKINGEPRADKSGIGRNTLSYTGSQFLGAEEVEVDILRRNGLRVANGTVVVPSAPPILRIYRQDPLRGLLSNRSLSGSLSFSERELSLVAEPFFTSGEITTSGRQYTWSINNNQAIPSDNPRTLTVRQDGSGAISASIEASVQHTSVRRLLQQAQTGLVLTLGAGESSTIFGI